MRVEVLGVRLIGKLDSRGGGSTPIQVVEVPLNPGFIALAGVNGVGKTSVLDGVSAALRGRNWEPGTWELLFRLVDGDRDDSPLAGVMASGLKRWGWKGVSEDEDRESPSYVDDIPWRDGIAYRLNNLWKNAEPHPAYGWDPAENQIDGLADVLAQQANFAICNDGRTSAIWLAFDPRAESGAELQLMALLDEVWQQYVDREEDDPYAPFGDDGPSQWVEFIPTEGGYRLNVSRPFSTEFFRTQSLPMPLFHLGGASGSYGQTYGTYGVEWSLHFDGDSADDLEGLTEHALTTALRGADDVLEALSDEETGEGGQARDVPRSVVGLARGISASASDAYLELVGEPLDLRLHIHAINTWIRRGPGFSWASVDRATGRQVELQALSRSQRRWARFAIALALRRWAAALAGRTEMPATWTIIDEPEAGTHRAAEPTLARGLTTLAASGLYPVVATHSPAIAAAASHVHVVTRGAATGSVCLHAMPDDVRAAVDDLGIRESDVLGWYRTILFVEGAHDEVVIERFLAEDLSRTRTLMIPIRGVKESGGIAEARLLDFSDARVIVLIDSLGPAASSTWAEVTDLIRGGAMKQARHLADDRWSGGTYEERFLRTLVDSQLKPDADLDRVQVFALSVGDIIQLLPAHHFLPDNMDWAEARSEFEQRRDRKETFKEWLRRRSGRPASLSAVRKAAEAMQDSVPPDLIHLARLLET